MNASEKEWLIGMLTDKEVPLSIEEKELLWGKYQDYIVCYRQYDPWTCMKKKGINQDIYLFIRAVYASLRMIIPWVSYSIEKEVEDEQAVVNESIDE